MSTSIVQYHLLCRFNRLRTPNADVVARAPELHRKECCTPFALIVLMVLFPAAAKRAKRPMFNRKCATRNPRCCTAVLLEIGPGSNIVPNTILTSRQRTQARSEEGRYVFSSREEDCSSLEASNQVCNACQCQLPNLAQ